MKRSNLNFDIMFNKFKSGAKEWIIQKKEQNTECV